MIKRLLLVCLGSGEIVSYCYLGIEFSNSHEN